MVEELDVIELLGIVEMKVRWSEFWNQIYKLIREELHDNIMLFTRQRRGWKMMLDSIIIITRKSSTLNLDMNRPGSNSVEELVVVTK